VLDAGCGSSDLAGRLSQAGYDVTAIDIDPGHASPTVQVADICTYEDEPFDAVVFSLSLHHVHSLDEALDRASALLKPGGSLIVDEFAHERADSAIADRFFGEPHSLRRWREHHRALHTGDAMIEAISARFTITSLARVPYLHRYLEDDTARDIESVLGLHLTALERTTPMPIIRTTRYTVAPSDLDELLPRRAALIARIRAEFPGLTDTRLTRLSDGTYADSWCWSTHAHMEAALAAAPTFPEAAAAFASATNITAENAELLAEQ